MEGGRCEDAIDAERRLGAEGPAAGANPAVVNPAVPPVGNPVVVEFPVGKPLVKLPVGKPDPNALVGVGVTGVEAVVLVPL
jgi:hypothetical protein